MIKVPQEITNYFYIFIESNISGEKDGYFYFKFKGSFVICSISLSIIQENGNKAFITIDNSYWLWFNITNLKSQKNIIQIKNEYSST